MYITIKKSLILLIAIWFVLISSLTLAGTHFNSNYPCNDAVKTCISSGTRIVDGFEVHRDCWEWSYVKTCNYPSRDDCKNYNHCYAVTDLPCLLKDSLGNCVNLQKEFSCKSWEPVTIDKEIVRTGLVAKEGKDRLVCKGVPCIDGNCIDKSYLTDGDMMDSVSKLYAVSQMKGVTDLNFKLFAGFAQSCSKKATSYTNCCSTSLKGWGKNLGAKCTKDEIDLVDKRQKNLCVYVCKENKQTIGITTIVKHHYCCFGSLLNKVIQVEGRKQLNINFGSEGNINCRGLTLAEIMKLDFDKMDFSEFFTDILKRMKIPKIGDISARVNSSLPNVRKYDNNPNNKKNNMTGWNADVKDDSWEAQEERRIEAEHIERERINKLEVARAEQARLVKLEEERIARDFAKEQERQRIIKEAARAEQARLVKLEKERIARDFAKEQERQRIVEMQKKEAARAEQARLVKLEEERRLILQNEQKLAAEVKKDNERKYLEQKLQALNIREQSFEHPVKTLVAKIGSKAARESPIGREYWQIRRERLDLEQYIKENY